MPAVSAAPGYGRIPARYPRKAYRPAPAAARTARPTIATRIRVRITAPPSRPGAQGPSGPVSGPIVPAVPPAAGHGTIQRGEPAATMPWDPRIERWLDRYPALRAVGNTPLVPVSLFRDELPDVEVWAKMELLNPGGSLKDRPVLRMVLGALADGRLRPGQTLLDSSSGNAGIAYAMIGRLVGFPVEIVIPDNASSERKKRLHAHGARLVFTDALLGYDEALREVRRRHDSDPDRYFFCDQYSNPDNWRAHYETTAAEILADTGGRITHVVTGVGTGGTLTGLGRRLKEHDPRIRVVCVIPDAFPGIEGLKPLGHPDDIVPVILDEKVIDERIPVTGDESYAMCQRLARAGFFVGQSSGAYLVGVERVARRERRGRFVTLFNDLGERYFSTRLWD
jgi:cysteine synthase B